MLGQYLTYEKRATALKYAFLCCVLLFGFGGGDAFAEAPSCLPASPEPSPTFMLTLGQDYALTLDDGRMIKLIGLDFPASQDTPFGQATKQALQDWLEGVPLHVSVLSAKDRWGRLPALVTLEDAAEAKAKPPTLLQSRLLEAGFARFSGDFEGNDALLPCAELLQYSEAVARLQKQNLWQNPNFAPLSANQPASVWQDKLGRFIVVEGVVASVGRSHGRVYLNFKTQAPNNPRFSVVVPPALVAKLEPIGALILNNLKGQTLLVRGILIAAGLNESPEPQIVLASPAALAPADAHKTLTDLLLAPAATPALSTQGP